MLAYYEQLAEEFVPMRNGETFLMNDDKFYLNEWMDTFIKCQIKIAVEKSPNGVTITWMTNIIKIHVELIKLFKCV